MTQNILLDPSIRDWVLLPLLVIVIFMGILRHYLSVLMGSNPKPVMTTVVNANIAQYGQHLLGQGGQISDEAFQTRVVAHMEGPLQTEVEAANPMEMMNDPNVMMGMMKNQFMGLVPNIGMMMLVSHFFSGFVVAKFPFPLSHRFRDMMQRGLDIDDLDCNYVTSLSMYFLIMSGCQGMLELLLGQDVESMAAQAAMMPQMGGAPGTPVDYRKIFKQVNDELDFVKNRHKWAYANAPDELLKDWRVQKRKAARAHSR